jgi:hypothetical protein
MTQSQFIEQLASAAVWGRTAKSTDKAIVLFFKGTLPYGLGCEFQRHGLKVLAGQWYGVKSNGGRAVKIGGSPSMLKAIVAAVAAPKSRGSRTAGNLLPW